MMHILFYKHYTHSLDPVIYRNLVKHAKVFTIGKKDCDILIDHDDGIDEQKLRTYIEKHKITHFLYAENSSYLPIFMHLFPKDIVKVMLLIDTHINFKRRLPYVSLFDIILLVNKHQVEKMKRYNPNTVWLTYGSDTDTFYKIKGAKKVHDVVFNGNIIPWIHYHRFFMLAYLKWRKCSVLYSTATYEHHNALFNASRIVLNRTPLGGWNLRIFEGIASGSLVMSDYADNQMTDILKDKEHLVYYTSLSDLKKKIDYYLEHEDEREAIAARGYAFIRKEFSWDAQIDKMLTILQTHVISSFTRKPYFLSLFDLECYSFRNKRLALQSLEYSYEAHEITFWQYYFYNALCRLYLSVTQSIIIVLNIIRIHILVKAFAK